MSSLGRTDPSPVLPGSFEIRLQAAIQTQQAHTWLRPQRAPETKQGPEGPCFD